MPVFIQRLFTLTLIFFLLLSVGYTQEIEWGENVDSKKRVSQIIGEDGDEFFVLAYKGKTWYFEKYKGNDAKLAFSKPIDIPQVNDIKTKFGGIYRMETSMIMLTYQYDKSKREFNLFGYTLSNDGKVNKDRTTILNVPVEKKGRMGDFKLDISRDRSKMLIVHIADHKKGEKYTQANIRILTPELVVLKEIQEKYPMKEDKDRFEMSDIIIDNDGSTYMGIARVRREKGEFVTDEINIYSYIPNNGFELTLIPVDLNGKVASSIMFEIDRKGNLVGGGFYGERVRSLLSYTGLKGSYFLKVDRVNEEIEYANIEPFSKDLTAQILSERKANKGKLVSNYFVPRNIVMRDDGGAIMAAEYSLRVIEETRTGTIVRTYHGPIIIVSISPEGVQEWARAIPKNQFWAQQQMLLGGLFAGIPIFISVPSAKDQSIYHSFLLGVSEKGINLVYIDHKSNIELEHYKDTKRLNGWLKSVPVSVTITPDGKVTKKVLAERDRTEVVLRPKISYQGDYKNVIIYGNKRKQDKFGRITF